MLKRGAGLRSVKLDYINGHNVKRQHPICFSLGLSNSAN